MWRVSQRLNFAEKMNRGAVHRVQGKRKYQQKETNNNEEDNRWIRLRANRPIGLCADKHDNY
jgi:hypothetical protein